MELPEHNFTFAISPIPSDFLETHTTHDEMTRALDSRYWETRVSYSCDLHNQTWVYTSTLDSEKVIE